MQWCALLTAVKNYSKSLEKLQDFFFKTNVRDQDQKDFMTKTFIFVLEAPRDQDPIAGLEDKPSYITAMFMLRQAS